MDVLEVVQGRGCAVKLFHPLRRQDDLSRPRSYSEESVCPSINQHFILIPVMFASLRIKIVKIGASTHPVDMYSRV